MTGSRLDVGKRLLPAAVKESARHSLRAYGVATASLRSLPDFLVLGTKRGGTTSVWNYLLQHPGVLPMWPAAENLKSPHYFYWHYNRGRQWYRSFFPTTMHRTRVRHRLGHQVVAGEASPYYLYDPRVPGRVLHLMPDVKLIVLLRDPVERAFSHYKERVRAGVENLSFEEALSAEPRRLAGELERMQAEPQYYSRPHDWFSYRNRGIYHPQLVRWQQHFASRSMLVLRSEDFYSDPTAALHQVHRFLGLPEHSLRDARRWNYRPAPGMLPATRAHLEDFYRPHNAALQQLLDRDFPWS